MVDFDVPFELTIKGELLGDDGKPYPAGVYQPGELPSKLMKDIYGHNVPIAEVEDLEPLVEVVKKIAPPTPPPVSTPQIPSLDGLITPQPLA